MTLKKSEKIEIKGEKKKRKLNEERDYMRATTCICV